MERKFNVVIEKDEDYIIILQAYHLYPDAQAQATAPDELMKRIKEAIELWSK
ncbi:MAG: hypothetical protein V3R82_05915 [Candidatus Hydrothermarchaeales archaeon]